MLIKTKQANNYLVVKNNTIRVTSKSKPCMFSILVIREALVVKYSDCCCYLATGGQLWWEKNGCYQIYQNVQNAFR